MLGIAGRRFIVACVVCLSAASSTPAVAAATSSPTAASDLARREWVWPLAAFRLDRPYLQPAHRYGTGHRGIDLDPLGEGVVRSPADGIVAFSGDVAGRGILTIDHGDGLVTTLEPVSAQLAAGTAVDRGEIVAIVATGGHTASGMLHFGVRLDGEYINPMLLLGGVPRAVLLPCC